MKFRIEFIMVEKSNQKKIGTARKDLGMSLGTQRYAMQVGGRVRDDNRRQLTRQRYTSHSFFSFILILSSYSTRLRALSGGVSKYRSPYPYPLK